MEIPLATRVFPLGGNGTLTLGILYAAVGLGTGLGPLLARRWLGDERNGVLWAITASFLVMSSGILVLGFAPALAWVVVATLLRSFGSGSLWVFSSALLQHLVADEFRGRVFAFEFAALTLSQSIATVWAGLALDQWQLGVQPGLVLTSLLGFVVSAVWGWFHLRHRAQPVTA
jgi:MFS family permease